MTSGPTASAATARTAKAGIPGRRMTPLDQYQADNGRSWLWLVVLARLVRDPDQALGVMPILLQECGEFRGRSRRRQDRLLFQIVDEFRLAIKPHELCVEPVHDRLRHAPGRGEAPPAERRKIDARLRERRHVRRER